MTAVVSAPPATEAPARTDRKRAPLSLPRFVVTWICASLAINGLFLVAFATVFSSTQEHSTQKRLYGLLRQQLAEGVAPRFDPVPSGKPVVLLQVPQLGLRAVVVEGTDGSSLRSGPGHRRDTVLPGSAGVSVILGKAATYGAPFAHLDSLRPGDVITTVGGLGTAIYHVDRLRRPNDPLPPPLAAGKGRLVLASIDGSGWRDGLSPKDAIYVDASLIGKPAATSTTQTVITKGELFAAQGDPSSLLMLVFWLQLLVLALIALAWGVARWGLVQAWLAGMPAVLALLWLATNAEMSLLPNVF